MDKRKEANQRVKKNITESLFLLMQKKELSEITVTEIIKKAGVARASFYRNYQSKEEVLSVLIDDILEKYLDGRDFSAVKYDSYEGVRKTFSYFEKYQKYALGLHRCGFTALLCEKLNAFHELVAGSMPVDSIERYSIYIFMGALLNTALSWLSGGKKESVDEISAYFFQFMQSRAKCA